MKITELRARANAIKEGLWGVDPGGERRAQNVQGSVQATISILSAVYSDPSPQLANFTGRLEKGLGMLDGWNHSYDARIATEIESVLDAAIADCEAGLTGNLRVRAKGEVLGDFVALAREALEENGEDSDRVAGVLAAAALEETLKQLGESTSIDVYNRDMRGVIQKLKDGGVLEGPQAGLALGYSQFRDKAFHGQFEEIERATTVSALAFVEGLLTTRFV